MAGLPADLESGSARAGSKRILIIVLAGVLVLAGVFVVTKLVMPHTAPSNPIAAVTSAPGKARAVAAASDAASSKLNAATGSAATGAAATPTTTPVSPAVPGATTATTTAAPSGPQPNTTRNPFLP